VSLEVRRIPKRNNIQGREPRMPKRGAFARCLTPAIDSVVLVTGAQVEGRHLNES
jgi:hypothetical protein